MAKQFKIQFRDGLTHKNLYNYEYTNGIVEGSFNTIAKAYKEKNKDRRFGRHVEMNISKETFIKIQKELKCNDKTIIFLLDHKQFFSLCAKKEEDKN